VSLHVVKIWDYLEKIVGQVDGLHNDNIIFGRLYWHIIFRKLGYTVFHNNGS